MPYFNRGDIQFHFLERGKGVPVFFQHGLGGSAQKIFDLLKLPSGFRLLGMDARAHGNTRPMGDVNKMGFDSFAEDLVALLDHLKIPQAILGGTSMGAGLVLNCALRFPRRALGLILLRPAWLDAPNPDNVRLFALIAKLIREHGTQAGLAEFKKTDSYRELRRVSSDAGASLEALFQEPDALETVVRLERIPNDCPNHDRTQWRSIKVPTLVMATRQDPIHPFEFGQVLAQEIPGAQFRELTPKSIDVFRYTGDLHDALTKFLKAHFLQKNLC